MKHFKNRYTGIIAILGVAFLLIQSISAIAPEEESNQEKQELHTNTSVLKKIKTKAAAIKGKASELETKVKTKILGKFGKSQTEVIEEIKKIKTEYDAAEFVIKTLDSLSRLEEAVFTPLYELIKPLPLIPLGPLPFVSQVPVVGTTVSEIADIGDLINDVQIEAHIASLTLRLKDARKKFDQLTHEKYVTKKDRELAEREEKEEHSIIGRVAQGIEKVTEPLSKVIEKAMKPLEEATDKIGKKFSFFTKPIVELTHQFPMIPLLGPISTFEYLVHIRSLQQHMEDLETIIANKLKPIDEKAAKFTTFDELKAKADSNMLGKSLEKVIQKAKSVEHELDNLLQPLGHFPFLTGFVIKSGMKLTKWAIQETGDVLEVAGGATAEVGVGFAGVAAGAAIKIAPEVVDELITGLIYRTFIRNLEQVLRRLSQEIIKEQTAQKLITPAEEQSEIQADRKVETETESETQAETK